MSDRVLKTKDDELKQANWKVKAIEEEVRCAEEKARAESSKHNRELIELYDRVSELIGDEDDQGDPPYMCKLNCPWVVNQATFLLAPRGFCLVLHDLYSHLWWKNAIAWKAPISMVSRSTLPPITIVTECDLMISARKATPMSTDRVKYLEEDETVSHDQHMCYLAAEVINPFATDQVITKEEYEALVSGPRFRCETCGRMARNSVNLCEPQKLGHNTDCASPDHDEHLCYLVAHAIAENEPLIDCGGWPTPVEFEGLVNEPKYKCKKCGRVANNEEDLCEPVSL